MGTRWLEVKYDFVSGIVVPSSSWVSSGPPRCGPGCLLFGLLPGPAGSRLLRDHQGAHTTILVYVDMMNRVRAVWWYLLAWLAKNHRGHKGFGVRRLVVVIQLVGLYKTTEDEELIGQLHSWWV